MRVVLSAVISIILVVGPTTAALAAEGCSEFDESIGDCSSGTVSGGGVSVSTSGTGASSDSGTSTADGISDAHLDDSQPECTGVELRDGECWTFTGPGKEETVDPITWADIEHFIPKREVATMEPSGWSVVGLNSNFFATGGAHDVNGEVMGIPTTVRFTPRAWHWNYGDGTRSTEQTPGASWASLGLDEFDRTPTSHVFERRGRFTVALEVEYAAEYSFDGGGWTPIPGTLTLPSATMAVRVANASTVLVGDECGNKKSGPGC